MFRSIAFLLFVFLVICQSSLAQTGEILSNKEIKQLEREGEGYYESEEYGKALKYFLQLGEIKPNDAYYNLVIGICYSYQPDSKEKSLEYLEKAKSIKPDFDLVDLYLGRAYYKNNRFQRAKDILNDLLAKEESDEETETEALQIIEYCNNALDLLSDTADAIEIYNMGSVINSSGEEYVPLITPDESQLIFTYRGVKSTGGKLNDRSEPDEDGDYFEDIFISYKSPDDWMYDEDIWLEPKSIQSINTDKDDACIALSIDGQSLYLYKYSDETGGDIYYSQLDGDQWGEAQPLQGDVNSKYWEGSVSIASDGQLMYFASDRPGGFGGRDLYRSERLEDGTWGKVTNLGPGINTAEDDDSPFLHLDRKVLYFSSKGHNSIGGYDVFFAVDEDGKWVNPTNMGAPINTTEDDVFYVASADGRKGFYSSSFGENSQGSYDIYVVSPDPGRMDLAPVAALIIGTVYANDQPTGAIIRVMDETNGKTAGEFHSNTVSGDYRIALLPGSKYKIEVSVEDFETHEDEIDLESLHEYIEVSNNIYLYTEEYKEENDIQETKKMTTAFVEAEKAEEATVKPSPIAVAESETPASEKKTFGSEAVAVAPKESIPEIPVKDDVPASEPPSTEVAVAASTGPCEEEIADLSSFIGKDLNIEANYNALKNVIGKYCAEKLEFKVQIGAYRFPQNFKYNHLQKFGEAKVTDYPDGITRFTMGSFNTLNSADALRQKIRSAGQKDAWVIPFYDGQRIFMEDLISVNFYDRPVN